MLPPLLLLQLAYAAEPSQVLGRRNPPVAAALLMCSRWTLPRSRYHSPPSPPPVPGAPLLPCPQELIDSLTGGALAAAGGAGEGSKK